MIAWLVTNWLIIHHSFVNLIAKTKNTKCTYGIESIEKTGVINFKKTYPWDYDSNADKVGTKDIERAVNAACNCSTQLVSVVHHYFQCGDAFHKCAIAAENPLHLPVEKEQIKQPCQPACLPALLLMTQWWWSWWSTDCVSVNVYRNKCPSAYCAMHIDALWFCLQFISGNIQFLFSLMVARLA